MRRIVLVLVGFAFTASACTPPQRAPVSFALPRSAFPEFLEAPWPSDIQTRLVDGERKLDYRAFPNPTQSEVLDELLKYTGELDGWMLEGGLYFRVEAGVDADTLPKDPAASMGSESGMFLIELAHPKVRIPIEWQVVDEATAFLPKNTVAVLPMLGIVVDEPAALIVTSKVATKDGVPLGPSADLRKLLSCQPIEDVADAPDCAPYQQVAMDLGLEVDDVALVQIVTPRDPTVELRAGALVVKEAGPPRVHLVKKRNEVHDGYDAYEGYVDLAQFQYGTPPYDVSDGREGGFVVDNRHRPLIQRFEPTRFLLTVPHGTAPNAGWPVVVMGHGTGGDYLSGLGETAGSEAHQLAEAGWAMISVSEPLHNTRVGNRPGQEDLLTFNFLNPIAGRDNWRQSALEKMQLVSAVAALSLDAATTGQDDIEFDEDKVAFFGHSQGGIVGALFVGLEDRMQGAFLSGAGAGFAQSLLLKTEPVVIADAMRLVLGIPDEEPLDRFHPVLSLLQTWTAPSDPLYGGRAWLAHEDGRAPHLVVTSGLVDTFTPPVNHAALAAAFRLPLVAPVSEELLVLQLLGVEDQGSPAEGNVVLSSGQVVTAGVFQFPSDGHFAVFNNPEAQRLMERFFDTLRDGVPIAFVR